MFEVMQDAAGGFTAEALGESIFTEAESWEELRAKVQEAVQAFYFDRQKPSAVRLRMVRDELLANCLKLPRDVSSADLADQLCRFWDYVRVHQVGSRIVLQTQMPDRTASRSQPIVL